MISNTGELNDNNVVTDIEQARIKTKPDKIEVLLSAGNVKSQGFIIKHIELRQYREKFDQRLGYYSLITIVVATDKGSAVLKYDEGYRGEDALEAAVAIIKYAGLAAVINRALIELQHESE